MNIELHWKSTVIEHHAMTVQLDEEQAKRVAELVSAGRSLAAAVGVTLGEGNDNDDAQELLQDWGWERGRVDAQVRRGGGARPHVGQEGSRLSEQPDELLDSNLTPGTPVQDQAAKNRGDV